MASFVNYGSTLTDTTGMSITVPAPAGIQDGDILIAQIVQDFTNVINPMTCPNWNYITGFRNATVHTACLLWKRASGESGNYTFTVAAGDQGGSMTGSIACYRGFKASGDVVNAYSNTEYKTSDTILRAATCTPTAACWLLHYGFSYQRTVTPPSSPGSFNERIDTYGTEGTAHFLSDYPYTTGATGSIDATISGAAYTWKHAFLVALELPAVTGTDRTPLIQFGIC